jgi:hypothetical protein
MSTLNRIIAQRLAKTIRILRWAVVILVVGLLSLGATSALAHTPPINLSGYEIFLGVTCPTGTCGTTFSGWTGGSGPVAEGWQPFPGDSQGLWKATVNHTGGAGFGNTVILLSGRWQIVFTDKHVLFGKVTGGTVVWPPQQGDDIGCGVNVAKVTAALAISPLAGGGTATMAACLHDLPAGTVIPPTVWGTFSTP